MTLVTQLLEAAHRGDRQAAAELLPLVYDKLRILAAVKLTHEVAGHTLDATALVHEAYLRLIGEQRFDGRGHFFAAAAEAMRRILVENARRKGRLRHGGDYVRTQFPDHLANPGEAIEDVIAISDALDELARVDALAAELVKMHFFAGLTIEESAAALGVSSRKGFTLWAYARAWLYRAMGGSTGPDG